MKLFNNIQKLGKGFSETIQRFPLTIIFLAIAAITEAIAIQIDGTAPEKALLTFFTGAAVSIVLQLLYERFFTKKKERILFMVLSLALTLFYYFGIKMQDSDLQLSIQAAVIYFVLLISFLWVPVIKSRINFNQSFLVAFKAFFTTLLFQGVLLLGIFLILGAIDFLIINLDSKFYLHFGNIIYSFLAPIHFLSLIPFYPGRNALMKEDKSANVGVEKRSDPNVIEENIDQQEDNWILLKREEELQRFLTPGKFLEALVTYIILPITAILTVILLLYIIVNIRKEFWTDNLMEPLLVSYSITVILVYLLASTFTNIMAKYFRMIFPKVLVPIVLFQVIASLLKTADIGITYGRYYVILFGIFAVIAGVIFCFKPAHKNGLIAPIVIVLSIVSILPFVNAFTLSRESQKGRLQQVLEQNNMLEDNKIIPKADLSSKDKEIIVDSLEYLEEIDEVDSINWLSDYAFFKDFKAVFGFEQYGIDDGKNKYISVYRDTVAPILIEGYDYMTYTYIETSNNILILESGNAEQPFALNLENQELVLTDENGELLRFSLKQLFDKAIALENEGKSQPTEELTITEENSNAKLTLIIQNISVNVYDEDKDVQSDLYILIDFK
ncbi:MAG: DUF4153 domain-containing protein [Mobilitalea sp.]